MARKDGDEIAIHVGRAGDNAQITGKKVEHIQNTTTITGNDNVVSVAKGNITNQLSDAQRVDKLLKIYEEKVQSLPAERREEGELAIQELKEEVSKGDDAREVKLKATMKSLQSLVGDALQVAVATLANPAAGVALAMKKIADKALEDS